MSQVVVTSNTTGRSLVIKASLSIHLACTVADAFTDARDKDLPLHQLLTELFGVESYRWYCVDQSSPVYSLTFSHDANPHVLNYQGAPALIAEPFRSGFVLSLFEADLVRPGRLNPMQRRPHAILAPSELL